VQAKKRSDETVKSRNKGLSQTNMKGRQKDSKRESHPVLEKFVGKKRAVRNVVRAEGEEKRFLGLQTVHFWWKSPGVEAR